MGDEAWDEFHDHVGNDGESKNDAAQLGYDETASVARTYEGASMWTDAPAQSPLGESEGLSKNFPEAPNLCAHLATPIEPQEARAAATIQSGPDQGLTERGENVEASQGARVDGKDDAEQVSAPHNPDPCGRKVTQDLPSRELTDYRRRLAELQLLQMKGDLDELKCVIREMEATTVKKSDLDRWFEEMLRKRMM